MCQLWCGQLSTYTSSALIAIQYSECMWWWCYPCHKYNLKKTEFTFLQYMIVKVQHHDPWLPVLQRLSCQCMQFAAHSAQCLKYRWPKRRTFLIHHVQHCSQVWDGSHVLFTTLYSSVSVCQISISGSDVWAGNLLCCWHRSHACSYTSDIFMYTSLSWWITGRFS